LSDKEIDIALSLISFFGSGPHQLCSALVKAGLGFGIVEDIVFDMKRDCRLCTLPFDPAPNSHTAFVAFGRDGFMRRCVLTLVELLSPASSREVEDTGFDIPRSRSRVKVSLTSRPRSTLAKET